MYKNHDDWMVEKKRLERLGRERLLFHEREVWWCSLGLNLGDEQDGKNELFERPVLVLKKFNDKIAWVLPMTTQKKDGRFFFFLNQSGLRKDSFLILSQVRLVSVKRFRRIMTKIPAHQFSLIREKFVALLYGT